MCSALCPLLHCPKLVHGHKLNEDLLLAVSLPLPGWEQQIFWQFFPLDPLRLIPSGLIPLVRIGLVLSGGRNASCVV